MLTEVASRLRTIRNYRQYSRAKLASECGDKITARQIARIESGEVKAPRKNTVKVLADGLQVSAAQLTGDEPLPAYLRGESSPRAIQETFRVGGSFRPELRLAFDLVQRRYGWNEERIIALAPLMFVLLAEGCIAWQAQRLAELAGSLELLDRQFSRRIRVMVDQDGTFKPVELSDGMLPENFLTTFDEYLSSLAADIPDGLAEPMLTELWGGPQGRVCEEDLRHITGDSPEARWALEYGDALLDDIPQELTSDDETARRVQWLEGRLSEDVKSMLRERSTAGLPVGPRSIQKWHIT